MLPADPIQILATVLPHVRDPLPDTIGLGFPFTLAGAGDILIGALLTAEPSERRDQAARKAGAICFRAGAGIYVLALANQLTFGV